MATCRSLDCVSIFALTVADAEAVLAVASFQHLVACVTKLGGDEFPQVRLVLYAEDSATAGHRIAAPSREWGSVGNRRVKRLPRSTSLSTVMFPP